MTRVPIAKATKTNNSRYNCSYIVDMPGKDNKVSPRLPKNKNNYHSANGQKHEENTKLSKNTIESFVENNGIEAEKEIRGQNEERCEEKPTEVDNNEMIDRISETKTGCGKSDDLPPTCKCCFIAFAEKKSPVCSHQFCLKCYKNLEKQVCHNVIMCVSSTHSHIYLSRTPYRNIKQFCQMR